MNYSRDAKDVRDSFKIYFNYPEGSVPWQDKIVDYDGFAETAWSCQYCVYVVIHVYVCVRKYKDNK